MSVNDTKSERSPVTVVVALAGLVIISAGMRAIASVLVPVLIATFLAILLTPSVQALIKRNWPKGLAVVTTMLGTVIVAVLLTALVGDSLVRFSHQVPEYAAAVQGMKDDIFAWLSQRGIGRDLEGGVLDSVVDTSGLLALARNVLGGVANLAGNGVIILLLAAFVLLETDRRQEVFEEALGKQTTVPATLQRYTIQVVQYLKVKTWMSVGTGLGIALLLWLLGVDYPVLWGMLAFLLNFVPTVGSLIAAIPPGPPRPPPVWHRAGHRSYRRRRSREHLVLEHHRAQGDGPEFRHLAGYRADGAAVLGLGLRTRWNDSRDPPDGGAEDRVGRQ
jgi:predicted PurR-regulated permease PerM